MATKTNESSNITWNNNWSYEVLVIHNGGFSNNQNKDRVPFHRFRLSWRSALLSASGSPGLWFWRGGPAPARAAEWDFPWAPGAPSASPRATLPSARSAWQCDGAAPAPAPASPPAPCPAPACLPLRGCNQRVRIKPRILRVSLQGTSTIPSILHDLKVRSNVLLFGVRW